MGVTLEEENKDLGVGANCHCCWSDSDRTWEPGTVWLQRSSCNTGRPISTPTPCLDF